MIPKKRKPEQRRLLANIRWWREMRGVTLLDLAGALGVKMPTLYEYLREPERLRESQIDTIAARLKVTSKMLRYGDMREPV